MDGSIGTTKFNIRGTRYEIFSNKLDIFPDSVLANLNDESPSYRRQAREHFFDKDPHIFNSILNMLSHGKLHVPKDVCAQLLRDEMDFWGIPYDNVGECCWRTFFQMDEDREIFAQLRKAHGYNLEYKNDLGTIRTRRQQIWTMLEQPRSSNISKVWHTIYILAVVISSLILCLWTLEEFRTDHYLASFDSALYTVLLESNNSKSNLFIFGDPIPPLFVLDLICLIIFTVEFVMHFGACYEKRLYFRRAINSISAFVVFIMWLTFILEFQKSALASSAAARMIYFVCKAMTMARLFLFFRLEKSFGALRVLIMSIRSSLGELILMAISFLIATVIFANLIFFAEIDSNDTNGIHGIFTAMWWAIITMTTVGYGDYYPTSTAGYLVGVVCAVCGLMLIALPIAIIASNFTDYYTRNRDIERAMRNKKEREEREERKIPDEKMHLEDFRTPSNGSLRKISSSNSLCKIEPL